jgi:hypothetical protein
VQLEVQEDDRGHSPGKPNGYSDLWFGTGEEPVVEVMLAWLERSRVYEEGAEEAARGVRQGLELGPRALRPASLGSSVLLSIPRPSYQLPRRLPPREPARGGRRPDQS